MSTATREKLVSDFQTLAADTQELVRATAADTGEQVRSARERVATTLHRAQSRVVAAEAAVRTQARDAARSADTYVHDHPWAAIGVAGLCALALGILLGRR